MRLAPFVKWAIVNWFEVWKKISINGQKKPSKLVTINFMRQPSDIIDAALQPYTENKNQIGLCKES